MYLYTADLKTAELEGYYVKYAGGVSEQQQKTITGVLDTH